LVSTVLLLGAPVLADYPREEAARLLRRGNALHDLGDFENALARYQQARQIFPSYKIDFNVGVTLMAMARELEAAREFEQFLLKARKVAEPSMVAEARRRLERLRRRLASVAVACPVSGAVVTVEGAEVGRTPLEGRIYLRPGRYALAVSASGHETHRQQAALGAGQLLTIIVPWSGHKKPDPPKAVPEYARPTEPEPPVQVRRRPIYKRWWFWAGIVALAGGAATAVVLATRDEGSAGRIPSGELEPIR
jgi:tetratricopeptide (TPR) repeat protein